MEYFVGTALAAFVCGAAALLRMDRDRVFYRTVLIVVASYYVLFAVIGGGKALLFSELAIAAGFTAIAVLGFKRNLWLVAAALAGHGVLDAFHEALVRNPGVPPGWPGFCLTFDLTAAVLVSCVLFSRTNNQRGPAGPSPQAGRPVQAQMAGDDGFPVGPARITRDRSSTQPASTQTAPEVLLSAEVTAAAAESQ